MALSSNEDKLKKPDGTVITRSGIVDSSIKYYQQAYQEDLTQITDFSVGSEIRTIHESFAVELFGLYVETERQAKMKFVRNASGSYLDELACEYHLTRHPAEVATGSVVFTTSATINGLVTVPKDTIILDVKTGYEYVLDHDVYLDAPDTPKNGTVHSKLTGAKYNAPIDRLRTFQNLSSIRSEITVTNVTEITNGRDEESDEELRTRILNAKREKAWGTATAYSNLVREEVPDVHDIQIVDPEILASDEKYPRHYKEGVKLEDTYVRNSNWSIHYVDGKPVVRTLEQSLKNDLICTKCVGVVFVNAYSKPCPEDVLNEVQYVMTQQSNLVVGQKFHVERAEPNKIFLDIELFVTSTIDEDILYDHIECYFNGGSSVSSKVGNISYRGLDIGETLYKGKLIDVLENIPSVYQVGHIKQAKYNPNLPTVISQWFNNGATGWTYEDDEGYVYTRTSSTDTKTINPWGSKNFTYLETVHGTVFQLGQKKDVDDSTDEVFNITQIPVDETGKILITTDNTEN